MFGAFYAHSGAGIRAKTSSQVIFDLKFVIYAPKLVKEDYRIIKKFKKIFFGISLISIRPSLSPEV